MFIIISLALLPVAYFLAILKKFKVLYRANVAVNKDNKPLSEKEKINQIFGQIL